MRQNDGLGRIAERVVVFYNSINRMIDVPENAFTPPPNYAKISDRYHKGRKGGNIHGKIDRRCTPHCIEDTAGTV